MRKIVVQSQPWQGVHETPSQSIAGYSGYVCHSMLCERLRCREDPYPRPMRTHLSGKMLGMMVHAYNPSYGGLQPTPTWAKSETLFPK
jgi:hypothetical protein